MNKGPCLDCDDRTFGCHDHCIAYKRWKAERQKAQEAHREFMIQFHDVAVSDHAEYGRRKT